MPLKAGLKKKTEEEKEKAYTKQTNNAPLPKKTTTTAKQAAQTIKDNVSGKKTVTRVQEKRSVQPKTSKQKQVYNRNEYKWTASDKKSYKVGDSDVNRQHGKGTVQYPTNLRDIIGKPTNPDADTMKIVREARETGTQTIKQSGHQSQQNLVKSNENLRSNERHQAYSDPYTRAVAQEVFATNPAAKFLGSMSESFLNYSPIGGLYGFSSGENVGTEFANKNPELYNRYNEGVSARLGNFVGASLGTQFLDVPFENWATGKSKAVLEGTKLGQKIKNSAVNGRIGQYIGKEAMGNRLEQYLSNQILNSTVEATQNALGAYNEGYRGKDLIGQTLKQTAFDVGLSSAISGLGLSIGAGKVWKGAKNIDKESVGSIIKSSNTKVEYLNNLMNRLRTFNDAKYDTSGSRRIGDVSGAKAKEYADEYRKVLRMTDEEFVNYKNGGATNEASGNVETKTNNKPETKNDTIKSKITGKDVRSPKSSKATLKTAEAKSSVDYSSSYGEPDKGIYRINPKQYESIEEAVSHEGQSRISINDLENRIKDNSNIKNPVVNEEPTIKETNEKRNRVIHSDGVKRRASVEDFKDRLNSKNEIERFENIKKEVRENFPEATAEEREALATAMRNNDLDAYQKVESDIRARVEASINETALKANNNEISDSTVNKAGIGRQNELQSGKSRNTQSRRLKTAEEIKAENQKNIASESKTDKKIPDTVEQAIDGKTDWHNLIFKEKRTFARELGFVVPDKINGHNVRTADLDKIIEDGLKRLDEGNAKATDISEVAKKTAKAEPTPISEIPSSPIEDIKKLEKGSYVIHKNYGIGEFTGIEKVGGEKMARVKFADSDSGLSSATYVPLEKVDDFLSKYAGEGEPKLDKMFNKRSTESTNAQFEDYISGNADPNKKITETGISDFNPESPNGGKATIGGDTYTVKNNGKELPKKKPKGLTGEHGRKAIERTEKWKEKNLPKKEKVNAETIKEEAPKTKKPFTSESTSDDITNKFGESKKSSTFSKIDETISQSADGKTTKSYETYMRSTEIDDEAKKIMKELHDNNEAFIKTTVTNKQVLAEAERKAKNNFDELYNTFMSNAKNSRQATSQDEADALILVRELCNRGEFGKAAKVNAELSAMATENARFLQAQRIWRALTPEGRVRSTLSSIRRLEKSRGMESGSIKIGEEGEKLLKAIYDAETNAEIAKANGEFQRYIWNQVPSTFAEKCNAWRYLAMLANPKTHIRNVLGNAAFIPARTMSNAFATVGEKIFAKRIANLGGDVRGTHAILNIFSPEDRALYKKAGESFKDDRALMESMSAKFLDKQRPAPKMKLDKTGKGVPKVDIESSTFRGKILQFLEWLNSSGLEKEDEVFMGITYRSAYAQYCKANGIKASDITEDMAKRISDYAQEEALRATYRDANALADAFNRMRKNLNVKKGDSLGMKIGKKSAGFLLDSTVPFVKTPLNILKQGVVEYSPIRAFHGLAKIASAKDAESLLKGIQYASTGLTGTGVLVLGAILGARGYLNGSMGKYDKKVAYDEMLGEQDYSVTIPFSDKNISINLDWVAPMSMPLFVGVEFGNMLKSGSNNADDVITYAIEALSNISDPIFEMSMLQGVENVFNTAVSDSKGLSTIAKNAGFNYASQYVPTLFGQISRTMADNRKTVLSTSDNPLVKEFEKQFGKILNKTPIGNAVNQDYVDQWGRVQSNDNKGRSVLENFISPAYLKNKNETAVDTEIKRLYDALDEENKDKVIPSISSTAYKQKLDDEEYTMTPSEFTQYKKTVGQAKFNGLKELFSTKEYKNASDDEKRKMIESVYDDAAKEGKKEFLTKASSEFASAPDFYILDKTTREKYNETIGMSKEEWAKTYTDFQMATKKNDDGTGGLNADEKRAYLLDNGVKTYEQAQSFLGESTSKDKWDEAVELKKSGKTLASIQKEAKEKEQRQKNMTESEKKFDDYSKARADTRYAETSRKVISKELYNAGLYELQYVDKHTDNNGSITQSEAMNTIENLDEMFGLTNEQKAYYWYLFQPENGWKKTPYGEWKG